MWLARDDPGVLSFVAEETRLSKVNKAAFHKSVYCGSLAGSLHSPTDRMVSGEPDGNSAIPPPIATGWRFVHARTVQSSVGPPTRRVDRPPVCGNSTIGFQSSHFRGIKPCQCLPHVATSSVPPSPWYPGNCDSRNKAGTAAGIGGRDEDERRHVRLRPEIEPLVRLLEDTSREQLSRKLPRVAAYDISGGPGRTPAGRDPQHPAASQRWVQVPRCASRTVGTSGQPGIA